MAFKAVSRSNDPQWKTSGGEPPEGELQAEWINPRTHESVRPPEGYGITTRWFEIAHGEDFCPGDVLRLNGAGQLTELTAVTQTVVGVALECAVCPECDDLTPPIGDPKRPIVIPIDTDPDSDLVTDIIFEVPDKDGEIPTDDDVGKKVALDDTNGDWTIDIDDTSNEDVEVVGSHGANNTFFVKFLSAVIQNPASSPDMSVYGSVVSGVPLVANTWTALNTASIATVVNNDHSDDPGGDFAACGISAWLNSNEWLAMARGIVVFDLSEINIRETVSSAIFRFYVESTKTQVTGQSITFIDCSTLKSSTQLSAADFNNLGTTEYGTRIALGNLNQETTENNLVFNSDGITALNTAIQSSSQLFRMGMALSSDTDNSAPTWPGAFQVSEVLMEPRDSNENGQGSGLLITTDYS